MAGGLTVRRIFYIEPWLISSHRADYQRVYPRKMGGLMGGLMGFNGISWDFMGFNGVYPLVMTNIWKITIEIVNFPRKNGWIFQFVM